MASAHSDRVRGTLAADASPSSGRLTIRCGACSISTLPVGAAPPDAADPVERCRATDRHVQLRTEPAIGSFWICALEVKGHLQSKIHFAWQRHGAIAV